jgi:hypothetical protein
MSATIAVKTHNFMADVRSPIDRMSAPDRKSRKRSPSHQSDGTDEEMEIPADPSYSQIESSSNIYSRNSTPIRPSIGADPYYSETLPFADPPHMYTHGRTPHGDDRNNFGYLEWANEHHSPDHQRYTDPPRHDVASIDAAEIFPNSGLNDATGLNHPFLANSQSFGDLHFDIPPNQSFDFHPFPHDPGSFFNFSAHPNGPDDGAVSEVHFFDRNYLHAMHAHSPFCFLQQINDESLERKPSAMEISNRHDWSHQSNRDYYDRYSRQDRRLRGPMSDAVASSSRDHDEPLDRKPAARDDYDRFSYPCQAPIGHSYPTQDRNLKQPPYVAAPKPSTDSSSSSEDYAAKPPYPRHQPKTRRGGNQLKPPPSASISKRRTSQPPSGATRGSKKTQPKKVTPRRKQPTRVKGHRGAGKGSFARTLQSMRFLEDRPQLAPTPEELERARTPRKKEALITWYQRLNELIDYRDRNGHSKLALARLRLVSFKFLVASDKFLCFSTFSKQMCRNSFLKIIPWESG